MEFEIKAFEEVLLILVLGILFHHELGYWMRLS